MKVLISLARFTLGGTETYSVSVAEQLERLGHPVTIHAAEASPKGRELLASYGLDLSLGDPAGLDEFDVVLAQDAASAYELAARFPELRQVFAIHGLAAWEQPPAGLQPAPAVLVFNDRIASHAGALADRPELVRLTQPIDIERFRPRDAARPRARRVLLLSNYLEGARLQMLERVCDELGLELTRIGATGTPTASPQEAIADADIVVGYGRSVLEAMAMGRAAYVWDYAGGDGWVTPESYAAHEADGFSGAGSEAVIDAARLRADLAAYSPELGEFGWDLVRLHHSAAKHAERLVDVLEAASAPQPQAAATELARLVRLRSRAEIRVDGLETENKRMREALEAQHQRAEALEAQLGTLLGSRSWRLLELPRRLAANLRERLSKGGSR